jgi:cytochrome c oxidase assembly protein subunit 15
LKPEILLHRYTMGTAAWAAIVVFAGAMVTSTGSGMAVPDWPQSFGTWMPVMKGGVLFEHGHRMLAGTLAVLVLLLALGAARYEKRGWARVLTWGALVAVLGQALLGGLTVLRGTYFGWGHTDPIVSTLHAVLAQALLATLVAYATVSAPGWEAGKKLRRAPKWLAWAALGLVALVFTQIVVGAVMRHQNAGLIISDFPLNNGQVIPVFFNWLVAVNFAHRVGAWLLVGLGGLFTLRVARDARVDTWARRPAAFFAGAVLVQFLLGASVVLTHLELPVLTSVHVLGGSVLLASSLVLAIRLRALAPRKG